MNEGEPFLPLSNEEIRNYCLLFNITYSLANKRRLIIACHHIIPNENSWDQSWKHCKNAIQRETNQNSRASKFHSIICQNVFQNLISVMPSPTIHFIRCTKLIKIEWRLVRAALMHKQVIYIKENIIRSNHYLFMHKNCCKIKYTYIHRRRQRPRWQQQRWYLHNDTTCTSSIKYSTPYYFHERQNLCDAPNSSWPCKRIEWK